MKNNTTELTVDNIFARIKRLPAPFRAPLGDMARNHMRHNAPAPEAMSIINAINDINACEWGFAKSISTVSVRDLVGRCGVDEDITLGVISYTPNWNGERAMRHYITDHLGEREDEATSYHTNRGFPMLGEYVVVSADEKVFLVSENDDGYSVGQI